MKLSIKKVWKKGSKWLETWLKRLMYVVAAYALLALIIFGWQMAAGALRNPDADLVDNSELGKAQRRTEVSGCLFVYGWLRRDQIGVL